VSLQPLPASPGEEPSAGAWTDLRDSPAWAPAHDSAMADILIAPYVPLSEAVAAAELWEHQGQHQLNHIHDRLIVALRISVVDRVGDTSLRLAMPDRVWVRVAERAAGFLSGEQTQDS
jgi:hypothetical protein